MNILSRDKQIEIIAALCEGLGVRATARVCGVDRGSVASLALRVGHGCEELHDRMVVGVRVNRIELDELWAFVGKKQKRVTRQEAAIKGDQYTFIALAASTKAILSYRTGRRDSDNTMEFVHDLRERVIGMPEISSDGFLPYAPAIRSAFGNRVAYGTITKTLSVTDLRRAASHRYSPAEVVAVSRDVVSGVPADISTSYVERSHLSLRMSCRRFGRLTNAFSKKLEPHLAAVSLYVSFYNFVRVHEALRSTPAMALGIADGVWTIGDLLDAALAVAPAPSNEPSPQGRRKGFRVIEGGKP